ncbi:MAG: hypothetical protein E1N59_2572 [Puniceicoccaceae bacterium 5H]|nr:MAG: hypothetical protein E1N59_2572 [Puniceicoccaceae bacterium 5H]
MSNYNFDGSADGDWDEKGDLSWNEFDWQQFLKRQQKEISRFITFYDQHFDEPDRLDKAANRMGWDVQDWSAAEPDVEDEAPGTSFSAEEEIEETDFDPYTLHRHPVFVASAGLYAQIRYAWEVVVNRRSKQVDSRIAWKFAQTLHEGEMNMVMALQSLDMGDYMLAVVHLKWVLRALNDSLTLAPQTSQYASDPEDFLQQMHIRLFDLREICLRVMQDSREEERRGFRENE